MIDLQQKLVERFSTLRDTRRGTVFFVEHGLAADELEELRAVVRASFRSHSVESEWWNNHDLPLLVAAAEVGYRYRGTGTDFWPRLEEELGAELHAASRQRIRDLFERAAGQLRGARPPHTAWAQAFRLISWPITHALLPFEFHRPFAMTLGNLRTSVGGADDAALYHAIRGAASVRSARFTTLLADVDLVVSLTRCFLGQNQGELSSEIIDRLSKDLEADEVARRSVVAARKIQRRTRSPERVVPVPKESRLQGMFQLRRVNSTLMLEVAFPPPDSTIAARLRAVLRRRRFAPRFWGVTDRVPSDHMLSGLPFAIKFLSLPVPDAPLFPDDVQLDGLEPADVEFLQRFQLQLTIPLLFAKSADGDVARQVRGSEITGHRTYWLLLQDVPEFNDLCIVGEIGPLKCLDVDPASEVGARLLRQLGYQIRFGVSMRFAGAIAIRRSDAPPCFVAGEHCVLVPQRLSDGATLNVDFDGAHSLLRESDVMRIVVGKGNQLVTASNDTDSREYHFKGVESVQPCPAAIKLVLRSEELTVQALLAGRLTFSVDSFAPVNGLKLTVEIESANKRVSVTSDLEPLPQLLTAEHPIFEKLLTEDVREFVSGAESVTLRARIGHLIVQSWELERMVRPFWWDLQTAPRLVSEFGTKAFGVVRADNPVRAPMDDLPGEGAYLLAPIGIDSAEFGPAAQFTTLCLAPDQIKLPLPSIRKPHLLRRRRGAGSVAGLEDLIEAYLRWSLAETRTAIGELLRGHVTRTLDAWVTELCCGAEWSREEGKIDAQSPWVLFERACFELRLGHDSYIEVDTEQYAEVTRIAVAIVRRKIPWLWARVGMSLDLATDDYESLDQAFASAYTELAERYGKQGGSELAHRLANADPGDPPDNWNRALEQVQQAIDLRGLAAMLLPSDCAKTLMMLDLGHLPINEVADELTEWAKISRMALAGTPPTWETFRAIYSLWVQPELILATDWRGALDTLLAERAVARVTRYLAIRTRTLR